MQQNKQIPDGQRTKVIYTLIKEAKYNEVSIFRFRPSTISIMSCSFVPAVVPCPYWLTAITWARTSWTRQECTNNYQSFIRK